MMNSNTVWRIIAELGTDEGIRGWLSRDNEGGNIPPWALPSNRTSLDRFDWAGSKLSSIKEGMQAGAWYFQAASSSPLVSVRATLLYLGVCAMSRAGTELRGLTRHASDVVELGLVDFDEETLPGEENIVRWSLRGVKIEYGDFRDFLEKSRLDTLWQHLEIVKLENTEVRMYEILLRIPDIALLLPTDYPFIARAKRIEKDPKRWELEVDYPAMKHFARDYRKRGYKFTHGREGTRMRASSEIASEMYYPFLYQSCADMENSRHTSLYLVKDFNSGRRIPQIGTTYLLSYFLSRMANRCPHAWESVMAYDMHPNYRDIYIAAMNYVERAFPLLFVRDFLKTPITSGYPIS